MAETTSKPAETASNSLLHLSYATIIVLWVASQIVYIPYVLHLLVMVTALLYCACHSSLLLREEPEPDADGTVPEKETLRQEDAYQFPLIGSISLFSLYLAFKFLDKDMVNLLIGAYFAVVGCLALTMTIAPALQRILPSSFQTPKKWEYKLSHPLPTWIAGPSPWDWSIEFTGTEVVSLLLSAVVCAVYFHSKPWYLNNVLGISFCLQGIERFSLGNYRIGAILLIGLFFYDIFWVFGTDVMVTVAKNLNGPIKILFPRGSLDIKPETGQPELSLLGLGDIVIPGFFLALLLRYDAHNANVPITPVDIHATFPKPFFHSALLSYVSGLATTLFVMIQFNAAQPALLYLVPACLGSSLGCAYLRGELKELFEYSEETAKAEEEKKGDDAKKND